jgi:1-acyl-sn-glycerol-3-phosphate acyltransferase
VNCGRIEVMGISARLAQSLLAEPRVVRALEAASPATGGAEWDAWGFSKRESQLYYSLAYLIYQYFRPRLEGIERIPSGKVVVVANHSGQLPFDGLVLAVACLLEARPPRLLRGMAERWFPTLPFVNEAFYRSGVVLGDPINCKNLLDAGNGIMVFPEGIRGSGKTWDHRYRLVRFGRGFMRLALQAEAPIVPVSIVGAEESIISLYDIKPLARLLKMPYFPVPALLPLLGPLAYLPLPTRFYLDFGEPMRFDGAFDDEDEAIDEKVTEVMVRVQSMIDGRLARRESVFG